MKPVPLHPSRPERTCWGCDRYCPADDLACGKVRTPHPIEWFGDDWDAAEGSPQGACDRRQGGGQALFAREG